MSTKLFSLIHGDVVHLAPKVKKISAQAFSELMTACDVLKAVHEDAQAYKMTVAAESEKLKIEAQQAGFEEGFKIWAAAIAELETEIQRVQGELSKSLLPVVMAASKKIVGREIEVSDTIVDIVASGLKSVSQHKKVTIWVNKKDLDVMEANRSRLKQIFESLEALSIRERGDISRGSYMIETEVGIINGDLSTQWQVLEKALAKMLVKK